MTAGGSVPGVPSINGGQDGSSNPLRLGQQVRFRVVGQEGIAVHIGTSEVVGVNEAGALVLERAAAGDRIEDILTRLCQAYDVDDVAAVRADVERFLADLMAAGILEEAG